MKPLRKYTRATIYFRDHNEIDGEYFDVCVYSSIIIFFDKKGHERTIPMVFVKEIIEYVEDRAKEPRPEEPTPQEPINVERPVRKLQTPKGGKAFHV